MLVLGPVAEVGAALQAVPDVSVEAFGPLWTARVGRADARRHVLITAGLHAAELLGVAAALEVVASVRRDDVCFHVAPAVDGGNVERNAREVLRAGRLSALLELDSPRDLEGRDWDDAEPVRAWLGTIGRVDAYLSFHGAACLAGGAFFYVQGDGRHLISALRSIPVPLLGRDPTPVPSRRLEPGFFRLDDLGRGALAYVHARFAPAVSLVSEIPVGLVPGEPDAAECAALSRRYAADVTTVDARLLAPEDHVRWLVAAALAV